MPDYDKPSSQEDEFFAREEIEKMRKLALQQKAELETKEREALKQLHYMKCPKCGFNLQTITRGKLELDTCFNCHGIWFDAGEMERMLAGEGNETAGSVMRSIINIVRRK